MANWHFVVLGMVGAFAWLPQKASAQAAQASTVVTFALVPKLEDSGAVAVVIRRARGEQKNLILLRAGKATIGDVALSLGVLTERQARTRDTTSSAEERTYVKNGVFSTYDHDLVVRLNNIVASLREAPTREVRGIGKVPAVEIPLSLHRKL